MEDKRIYAADILRAAACIFIFHYHCNSFLPGNWSFLTLFGQDLGNNLFFMISGFILFSSIRGTPFNRLPGWYGKRLSRILPMLALVYACAWLSGYFSFRNTAQLFAVFIYPTLYWFVTAIMVFYLILFGMMKFFPAVVRLMICAGLLFLYFFLNGRQENLYVIGFLSMLSGCMLYERLTERKTGKNDRTIFLCIVFAGAVLYAAGKISGKAFFTPPGVLALGLGLLAFGYIENDRLKNFFERHGKFFRCLYRIGQMALPVYLVQCFRAGEIGFRIGQTIVFPWSYPVNFVIVWGLASLLYFTDYLRIRLWRTYRNR